MNKEKMDQFMKNLKTNTWPKTQEASKAAFQFITKFADYLEKYVKIGVHQTVKTSRKISLEAQKESVYYTLGKVVSKLQKSEWASNEKVDQLVQKIEALNQKIKELTEKS